MSRSRQSKQNNRIAIRPGNARERAIDILTKIEERQGYSNLVLKQELKDSGLDDRDRGFVTELVYGSLQRKNTIDFIIEYFLKGRSLETLDGWLRQLLRVAVYQIRYLDTIPDRAVAYEAVETAKRWGHQGIASFVNGIIRNILRRPEEPSYPSKQRHLAKYIALKNSIPEWLADMWLEQLGQPVVEEFLQVTNLPPAFTVRRNQLKIQHDAFVDQLDQLGIEWEQSPFVDEAFYLKHIGDVSKNPAFVQGLFTIQDESSMFVAKVMQPGNKSTILDACAAPGGKTTHIAEMQADQGAIVANELHPHKLTLIKQLVKRLGITSIVTREGDFTEMVADKAYDFVLLDAPCSGLGVIRRKPDLKWTIKAEDIEELLGLQKRFLDHAAAFVKPGGYLVYSTCTINQAENEHMIKQFLERHQEFSGADIKDSIPGELHVHMKNFYSLQILPHYMNSDGFFIAKLYKK